MRGKAKVTGRVAARGALAGILGAVALGWAARAVDDLLTEDPTAGEPAVGQPVDAAARVQEAAVELADSLRTLEGSLRAAEPVPRRAEELTAEENDRLIEAATKEQLAKLAEELDALSAALASGADPGATGPLLQGLARRAAALGELGRRTDRPLIPPEKMQRLMELWAGVRALSSAQLAGEPLPEAPE
jgi:hypothetical protein